MAEADLDSRVRARAFQFLREQTELNRDEVLPRHVLAKGLELEGQRVPLIAPQGIFTQAAVKAPVAAARSSLLNATRRFGR